MHATESLFWCNLTLKYCHGVTWIASTAHQISSWSAWQKCKKMKPRGFAFCWPLTLSQDQGHWKWYAAVKVNGTYKQSMYARNLLKSLYVMSNVKAFALQNRRLIDWVDELNWLHIIYSHVAHKKRKEKKKKESCRTHPHFHWAIHNFCKPSVACYTYHKLKRKNTETIPSMQHWTTKPPPSSCRLVWQALTLDK